MTQNLLQNGIKIEIKLVLSDAAFWAPQGLGDILWGIVLIVLGYAPFLHEWRPLVLFYSCKLYLFKADSMFIKFGVICTYGLLMFMFFRILIQKTQFED